MDIISGIKSLFVKDQPSDALVASRRRFIKGAAGLAAVAVVASAGGMRFLVESEVDRLKAMVASGKVVGQTFYLGQTATLADLDGVTFLDCRFIAAPGFVGDHLLNMTRCRGLYMSGCYLDTREISTIKAALLVQA